MTRKTWPQHLIAACSFVALAAGATSVNAQECETDADCSAGYACESYTTSCDSGELPPCPDGEDCPEPDPCTEETYSECVYQPIACTADSDCASGDICLSFTYEDCGDVAPDDGGDGREPGFDGDGSDPEPTPEPTPAPVPGEEVTCETVTEAFCAPAWAGGCEADADCGAGFTCVESVECSCSGSSGGGSVPPSPDAPTPTPDPDGQDAGSEDDFGDEDFGDEDGGSWEEDCDCAGTGAFYCEPQEIVCSADSDCPESWTCASMSGDVTCTFDAETGEETCEEGSSESYCLPPNWDAWAGVAESGDLGAPRAEAEASNSTGGVDDDALESAPRRTENEEGCTAAGGASTGALWLLGLLGLARRRRD